ncbi:MAG: family 78 glycoside hydrolase catalytic domain [Bacteroidia bacterium]
MKVWLSIKLVPFILLMSQTLFVAALDITQLRIEYLENPIGIEFESPRFSWWLQSDEMDVVQTAYAITIYVNGKEVFNSGKVVSNKNHLVKTDFRPEPKTAYEWRVTAWDNKGNVNESEAAYFETGLFGNWSAKFITVPWQEDPKKKNPVHYYRKEFRTSRKIKSARVYATSYGIYEVAINNEKVGDRELAPGWTSYEHRLKYQVYNADDLLNSGANCISIRLAQGWVQGRIALRAKPEKWQEKLAVLLELHIEYANGDTEIIKTDDSWKVGTGGLIEATIYDGEVYDAALEPTNWQLANFNDEKWVGAIELDKTIKNLVADHVPPVKVFRSLQSKRKVINDSKSTTYDFGQNFSGRVKLILNIEKPCEVIVQHAEITDRFGDVYTDNLRTAKAELKLVFDKAGLYSYTPKFTYMGFRYVKVKGISMGNVREITAQALTSNLEEAGAITTDHDKLNMLISNIKWSQYSNFIDVPIDCPQRDERMGWTGDAQVFAPTAAFNSQVAPFFKDWLKDLSADQYDDGSVPWVVPNVYKQKRPPASGWADAAVIIPWTMYERFGDRTFLDTQYPSMKLWVDFMINESNNGLWFGERHFGDWMNVLAPSRPGSMKRTPQTDFIAQVYFQYSLKLLVKSAEVIGKTKDAKYYQGLYDKANEAFIKEFVTPNGRVGVGSQTSYLLALKFDLLPEPYKAQAKKRLVESVVHYGHLTTGFLGTPILSATLSENGYSEQAYNILFREDFPSWFYQINMGATTMWERWDGISTSGSFQDPYVNSFNHYAYGSVGYWLYAHMGGIQLKMEGGIQKLTLAPEIDSRIGFANTSYDGINGKIISNWQIEEEGLIYEFTIPANTNAKIVIPKGYYYESLVGVEKGEEVPFNFVIKPDEISLGSGSYKLVLSKVEYD